MGIGNTERARLKRSALFSGALLVICEGRNSVRVVQFGPIAGYRCQGFAGCSNGRAQVAAPRRVWGPPAGLRNRANTYGGARLVPRVGPASRPVC